MSQRKSKRKRSEQKWIASRCINVEHCVTHFAFVSNEAPVDEIAILDACKFCKGCGGFNDDVSLKDAKEAFAYERGSRNNPLIDNADYVKFGITKGEYALSDLIEEWQQVFTKQWVAPSDWKGVTFLEDAGAKSSCDEEDSDEESETEKSESSSSYHSSDAAREEKEDEDLIADVIEYNRCTECNSNLLTKLICKHYLCLCCFFTSLQKSKFCQKCEAEEAGDDDSLNLNDLEAFA